LNLLPGTSIVICVIDPLTLAQMNGEYSMPPDAGPAWREAFRAGVDMGLIEENLKRTPWERLLANDSALALIRQIQQGQSFSNGTTD
jgi:hypothetical protein